MISRVTERVAKIEARPNPKEKTTHKGIAR